MSEADIFSCNYGGKLYFSYHFVFRIFRPFANWGRRNHSWFMAV